MQAVKFLFSLALALALGVTAPGFISLAYAQDGLLLEEIVVTARKREENLQDIPLSVSVFSQAELSAGGYVDLEDISLSTPGMQFNTELAGIRPGRLHANMRFRGVEGSEYATLQTASLFVDGVFALQAAQSLALMDLERVEIIKGPQSATFGRNSFAGAINYVTRTPSLDEFKGSMQADFGEYQQFEFAGSAEGPIGGNVAVRAGFRIYNKGEMYTASDGGALGKQRSKTIFATLYAQPSENFMLKARAYYQEDDDGPEAIAYFVGRFNDTCTGTTRPGLDEDGNSITLMPVRFVCGTIPGMGSPGAPSVDLNTSVFPVRLAQQGNPNYLLDNLIGREHCSPDGSTCLTGAPSIDQLGLERRMTRLSLVGEYGFANGMTLTGTLSYNNNKAANLRDFDASPVESWWVLNPQTGEDKGVDIRLESAQDGRIRWSGGVNVYDQEFLTATGGITVHACGFGAFIPGHPCASPVTLTLGLDGGDFVEVWSVYGAFSIDLTDQFTVDFEGRYQSDKRSDGVNDFSPKFDDFLPRLSISYKLLDNVNLYVTGSRGALPGVINTNLLLCSDTPYTSPFMDPRTGMPSTASTCEQYRQALGNAFADVTPAQSLDAFEAGIKSTWMDGRLLLNVAVYTQKWKDAPFGSRVTIYPDSDSDGIPDPNPVIRPIQTPGSSKYSGLELESAFLLNENWTANFSWSYNDNEFTEFRTFSPAAAPILGTRNIKGHRSSRFPEWSGSLSTTYTDEINAVWSWYVRGDLTYMGEAVAGETNLAILDSYNLINGRVGFEKEGMRLELYVKNLFDEDAWRSGTEFTDFSLTPDPFFCFCNNGVILLPQDKRSFGLRATYEF